MAGAGHRRHARPGLLVTGWGGRRFSACLSGTRRGATRRALAKKQPLCFLPARRGGGVMGNVVILKPHARGTTTAARMAQDAGTAADLRALQELQALCTRALEA